MKPSPSTLLSILQKAEEKQARIREENERKKVETAAAAAQLALAGESSTASSPTSASEKQPSVAKPRQFRDGPPPSRPAWRDRSGPSGPPKDILRRTSGKQSTTDTSPPNSTPHISPVTAAKAEAQEEVIGTSSTVSPPAAAAAARVDETAATSSLANLNVKTSTTHPDEDGWSQVVAKPQQQAPQQSRSSRVPSGRGGGGGSGGARRSNGVSKPDPRPRDA